MVRAFNGAARAQGLRADEMCAVESLAAVPADVRRAGVDLAVCSMGYHHIADVDAATRALAALLAPRGVLAVADVLDDGDAGAGAEPVLAGHEGVVAHPRGFAEARVRGVFDRAGLVGVAFGVFTTARKRGRVVRMFLATGRRAADTDTDADTDIDADADAGM
ncbi:hypothetical protein BC834DRAFT_885604 [Gloeopeniophorella convolvens]|nr:hypothetical protein BC834DRAFT_885604 [Gloeopeniophorella convolvens]